MDSVKHIQMLQTAYAGALAEAVLQYGKENVLSAVVSRKRQENLTSGRMRAAQLGITRPEEVFSRLAEIFGCANWDITGKPDNFTAQAKGCRLCAIARNIGAQQPCHLYCLNPMEGMVKAISDNTEFIVDETLWESSRCSIRVIANR